MPRVLLIINRFNLGGPVFNAVFLAKYIREHGFETLLVGGVPDKDEASAYHIAEGDIIRLYFGLNNRPPMTLEEIGMYFDLTRERVRQIKEKGIRRMKHNSRSKLLKSYLGS